jgi:hypothetical protein
MLRMANQAFMSVWCKDFSEERMIEQWSAFLKTVPFSATKPGFTYLVVRALDAAESPVLEMDLRSVPLDAAGIVELAQEHLHSDSCYEVQSQWDLWLFDTEGKWKNEPHAMEIFCYGEDYDNAVWQERGHLEVNLGFEHLFTGHAGLLGIRREGRAPAQSPEEARFLEAMAWPENLQRYQEKTRDNIRKLLDWVRKVERAMPVERVRLWSEGEENFEARVEDILVAH